jgi:hypothetical protein
VINFFFNSATQKHFTRHCYGSQKAGGTFLPFIDHIAKLIDIAHTLQPIQEKEQGRMRKAFVFEYPDPIGYLGITPRSAINEANIEYEYRDKDRIAFLSVSELPTTQQFTIVANWNKSRWNVVTAYPGGLSMPFPKNGMTSELYDASKSYWDRFVLVKKMNSTPIH